MKRILTALLSLAIILSLFTACGNSSSGNDLSEDNGLASTYQEPLNAQNFVSRLKDSDGFLYCLVEGSPFALYFEEENTKFKYVRISDRYALSIDYDSLSNESDLVSFEAYNDSQFSFSQNGGSYSYNLVYSDPENRFIIFVGSDDDYKAGDGFNDVDPFIYMGKENLKSYVKGLAILLDKYSYEMMDALYPDTMEDNVKLINDCIVAGKQF